MMLSCRFFKRHIGSYDKQNILLSVDCADFCYSTTKLFNEINQS